MSYTTEMKNFTKEPAKEKGHYWLYSKLSGHCEPSLLYETDVWWMDKFFRSIEPIRPPKMEKEAKIKLSRNSDGVRVLYFDEIEVKVSELLSFVAKHKREPLIQWFNRIYDNN